MFGSSRPVQIIGPRAVERSYVTTGRGQPPQGFTTGAVARGPGVERPGQRGPTHHRRSGRPAQRSAIDVGDDDAVGVDLLDGVDHRRQRHPGVGRTQRLVGPGDQVAGHGRPGVDEDDEVDPGGERLDGGAPPVERGVVVEVERGRGHDETLPRTDAAGDHRG